MIDMKKAGAILGLATGVVGLLAFFGVKEFPLVMASDFEDMSERQLAHERRYLERSLMSNQIKQDQISRDGAEVPEVYKEQEQVLQQELDEVMRLEEKLFEE